MDEGIFLKMSGKLFQTDRITSVPERGTLGVAGSMTGISEVHTCK